MSDVSGNGAAGNGSEPGEQGPSGPLSGEQGPSGPLSGEQGPSGPLSGEQGQGPDQDPVEVAREFLEAVVWGDHTKVWESFGLEARTAVLKVAGNRGMDEALSARLRDGTAAESELNEFLADLVTGLRADMAGNDLDSLTYELDTGPQDPGRARVVVNVPIPPPMGGYLPAASVELTGEAGEWKIVRLLPQMSK